MARLEPVRGSYARYQMIQPLSWQVNGASAPTVLRDGTNVNTATGKMFSVTRVSAGLFTVTLTKAPWPQRPFFYPTVEQGAAPTAAVRAHYVKNSWNATNRTFQVQVLTSSTNTASDGDAGDRVSVLLMGGLSSPGVDPA